MKKSGIEEGELRLKVEEPRGHMGDITARSSAKGL